LLSRTVRRFPKLSQRACHISASSIANIDETNYSHRLFSTPRSVCLRFDEYFNWPERAAKDQQEAVAKQIVQHLQSLVVAVGREALSENAEWLITHRARPLEPVTV
jgi:hypothetical protein